MKTVAIIQARMGSTRFPGKVMANLHGVPMIRWLVDRASAAPSVSKIIIATGEGPENRSITNWVADLGNGIVDVYVGSEHDVLERYYRAAKAHDADIIVRLTADDPLKDPEIIEKALTNLNAYRRYDYASNTVDATYPEGLDVEAFTFNALERAFKGANLESEREHVTPFIWKNNDQFACRQFYFERNLSRWRWTVDTEFDLGVMHKLLENYANNRMVGYRELIAHVENSPNLLALMEDRITERNAGYRISVEKEKENPNG